MITKYTKEEWMPIFQQREESGLSIRKWCDANHISYDVYKYWEKKFLKMDVDSDNSNNISFVELSSAAVRPMHAVAAELDVSLRLHFNGMMLDFSASIDPSQMAGILKLLLHIC